MNYFFSFIALIIIMIITGSPLHPTVLLAVYPILTMFIFSLGVGLVLSTMAVFFRDVIHLWEVFTTVLMYFSAIFYDPAQFGNVSSRPSSSSTPSTGTSPPSAPPC